MKKAYLPNKSIKQTELYKEIINHYGMNIFQLFESVINNDYEYNWLRVATRNLKRTVHPIRHLLLINFLEPDIDNFFKDINKPYHPFGDGPWPCLNKVANHYKKNIINNLTITEDYKSRLPVGTFSCQCGFVYSRKGPDKLPGDRYKIGRIKSFGPLWEEKLRESLKKSNCSLREIARVMQCDPKTIIKFDKKLEINYFKNSNIQITSVKSKTSITDKTEQYKNAMINIMNNNKDITRSKLIERCKKEYSYIYRKDRNWLDNNLPPKSQKSTIFHGKSVDWNKRDKDTVNSLIIKHEELLKSAKPIRITTSAIGKAAGVLPTLEKNIEKLPKTKNYLNQITETVEGFQIRRCKEVIDRKTKIGESIRIWELQKAAGIRSKDFEKIKNKILDYLN